MVALVAGIAVAALTLYVAPRFICRGDHQIKIAALAFVVAGAVAYLSFDLRFGGRVLPALARTILVAIVFFLPPGIAIPGLAQAQDHSRHREAVKEMEAIGVAIESFRIDHRRLPTVAELGSAVPRSDPWRHAYGLELGPDSWTVRSNGVCGEPGARTSYRFETDLVLRDGVWISGNEL